MPDVVDRELVDAITELHRHTRDPFALFVEEAFRYVLAITGHQVEPSDLDDEVFEDLGPAIAAYLRAADREPPWADVLGPVYSEVASSTRRNFDGQFFTPSGLSLLIAKMTLGNWTPGRNPDDDRGLWRLQEPSAGCGSMLLAFLTLIVHDHGPEALRWWYIEAWDVDRTVARTCALQLLVTMADREWPIGEVIVLHANALTQDVHNVILHSRTRPERESGDDHRVVDGEQLELLGVSGE